MAAREDLEPGILARVRRWLDGCPGEGERGIPAHLVTAERLIALGLSPDDRARALRFAADPFNHGVDDRMTPRDRRRYADTQRHVTPDEIAEPPAPDAPRHWSETASGEDPRHAALQAARAQNALTRPLTHQHGD